MNWSDPRGQETLIDYAILIAKPVAVVVTLSLIAQSIASVWLELEEDLHIEPYPPAPPPHNPFSLILLDKIRLITPDPGTWPGSRGVTILRG